MRSLSALLLACLWSVALHARDDHDAVDRALRTSSDPAALEALIGTAGPESDVALLARLSVLAAHRDDPDAARAHLDAARRLLQDPRDCAGGVFLVFAEAAADPDRARALDRVRSTVENLDLLHDRRYALYALSDFAERAFAQFDLRAAYVAWKALERKSAAAGWAEGEVRGLRGIARLHATMMNFDASIHHAGRAARIARKAGLGDLEAMSMLTVAQVHSLVLGDHRAAISILRNVLDQSEYHVTERVREVIHLILGGFYIVLDQIEAARGEYERVRELRIRANDPRGDPGGEAALLAHHGRYMEAIQVLRKFFESGGDELWVRWSMRADLGRLLIDCGSVDEGIEQLRRSVYTLERRRALAPGHSLARVRHFAGKVFVYKDLERALFDGGRHTEALEVAELTRNRVLLDAMSGRGYLQSLSRADRQERARLAANVVAANRQLLRSQGSTPELQAAVNEARMELEAFEFDAGVRLADLSTPAAPRNLADFSPPSGSAILYYSIFPAQPSRHLDDKVVAYVVRTEEGKVTVDAAASPLGIDGLRALVEQFRGRLQNRSRLYSDPAQRLYTALVVPVEPLLAGVSRVTIVADDFLWPLPFHALLRPDGRFFAETTTIAYSPSIALLAHARQARGGTPSSEVLTIAGPEIPEAVSEARRIVDLYGPQKSALYLGEESRESRIKSSMPRYRILHFATHGSVDPSNPLYSSISVGADANGREDGLLEVREIEDLALNADLVVLSACETGLGEVFAGEGVMGMTWALLLAGSRTTVTSLWKIPSASTAALMIELHRLYRDTGDAARSLRHAQLQLLRSPRWSHPYYWAGFVVTTDSGAAPRSEHRLRLPAVEKRADGGIRRSR